MAKATTTPEATQELPEIDTSLLVEALRESTKSFQLASQINTNLNEIERLMLVK